MNFSVFGWVLGNVGAWTWFVAQYRGWVMLGLAVAGFLAPFLGALGKGRSLPVPSVVIRSAAMALGFAAAAVTACSLLHFSDLRWLPPGQRSSVHVSPPGGLLSFAKPLVGVVNSVAGIPAEFKAIETSVNVAITCVFIALGALLVAALVSGRARRAGIRQIVRDEIRKSAAASAPELSTRR